MVEPMASKNIPYSRPTICKEEMKTTLECLASDFIGHGDLALEFEKQLEKILTKGKVKATASGTLSFFLLLKLLKVKPQDEIILPSYVPKSLLNPILYLGAIPVPVDVSLKDHAPLLEEVQNKMTPKTKALLVSHLFGLPVKVSNYKSLGIPIIEHASHALGATIENQPCGSLGDYAFFSFSAHQMISTGGTGGGIVCQKKEDQEVLSLMLESKEETEDEEGLLSYPFLMSNLQAAMGLSQLSRLNNFIESRKKIAQDYSEALSKTKKNIPLQFIDREPVFFQYLMKPSLPLDEALEIFIKHGVEVKKPIIRPIHRYLNLPAKNFPNTEQLYHENLSLPIYPTLKKKELELIVKLALQI